MIKISKFDLIFLTIFDKQKRKNEFDIKQFLVPPKYNGITLEIIKLLSNVIFVCEIDVTSGNGSSIFNAYPTLSKIQFLTHILLDFLLM